MTAVACLEWWWIHHHDAGDAWALLSAVAAQLVVGREGGIPIGLVGGASPWLVWQYSVMEDVVETLIGIGAAWWLLRPHRPGTHAPGWFGHVQGSLAPRLAALGKWRAVGLFAFTLVPFMLNGPIIAAVAGRMSGLGTRATFLAIAGGSLFAGSLWTLASVGLTSLVPNALLLAGAAILVAAVLARATWRRFTGAPHGTSTPRSIEHCERRVKYGHTTHASSGPNMGTSPRIPGPCIRAPRRTHPFSTTGASSIEAQPHTAHHHLT